MRPANWGPRALWDRVLARGSTIWRPVSLVVLGLILLVWVIDLLSGSVGEPEEVAVEASGVNAEELLRGDVLSVVLDPVEVSPRHQMNAALYRSTPAGDQLSRHYFVHSRDSDVRKHALMVITEVARRSWPDDYKGTFLTSLLPAVLEASRMYRVPPSVSLGQAILESGWGRSGLSAQHYNFFGIKAGSSKQRVEVPTLEYSGTSMFMTRANFKTYESKFESIKDHAKLLGTQQRYAHARPLWGDWSAYLAAIAPRYASAPTYAARVTDLIERYHLDAWDSMIVEAADQDL